MDFKDDIDECDAAIDCGQEGYMLVDPERHGAVVYPDGAVSDDRPFSEAVAFRDYGNALTTATILLADGHVERVALASIRDAAERRRSSDILRISAQSPRCIDADGQED